VLAYDIVFYVFLRHFRDGRTVDKEKNRFREFVREMARSRSGGRFPRIGGISIYIH
jgi:hypothetical protein